MTTQCITFFGSHYSSILEDLNKDRSDVDSYCDVTLVADNVQFLGHRCVLAKCSAKFHTIFKNKSTKHQSKITLSEISADVLSIVMEYIYTARIEINQENAMKILTASRQLQVKGLTQHCLQFFSQDAASYENILRVHQVSSTSSDRDISKEAEAFYSSSLESITEQQPLECFSKDLLLHVLTSRHSKCQGDREELIYKNIVRWTNHCLLERQKEFVKLLKCVKLHLLPTSFLKEVVFKEPLVRNVEGCKDYLITELFQRLKLPSASRAKLDESQHFVFIFGRCINSLNPRTLEVSEFPELPHDCSGAGVASCRKKLFVIGGRAKSKSILCLQLRRPYESWKEVGSTIHHRYGAKAFYHEGLVYITGGLLNETVLSSVECFDPSGDVPRCIMTTNMVSPRYNHIMTEFRGYLICAGALPSAEVFSYTHSRWTQTASCECNIVAAVSCKDLYVFDTSGRLIRLHPVLHYWENADSVPPDAGSVCAALQHDHVMYVLTKRLFDWAVCSYEPESRSWSVQPVQLEKVSCHVQPVEPSQDSNHDSLAFAVVSL